MTAMSMAANQRRSVWTNRRSASFLCLLTREPVGHGLEVDAGGGHALGVRHEAVSEVTPVREVLTHDAVMGGEQA